MTEIDDLDVINFFKENDDYDPITFFRWKGYQYQEEKQKAHSTFNTFICVADEMEKWRANAEYMSWQWKKSQADGTVSKFWRKLPKQSSVRKLKQVQ
ncbi:hypothetical protein BGX27_004267, partial [Mortierella sp. AM989]